MTKSESLYSPRAEERRKQFNRIIDGCDMVLMNNIVEVDDSIWENWEGKSPMAQECSYDPKRFGLCVVHDVQMDNEDDICTGYEPDAEVYQWFAVSDNDADFLKRHGQYVTYSDMLDTYFLAICHMGTSWDYVESMVAAFNDCYHGLDDFSDTEAN